ncbi:MAG: undecaprenyl-diphosphate phosphatase [Erysipelotrichaceae bacterium]|nr:undecaprenyl-diphosphate phosphatase [Erysipelotrichaceae bacterium]
MNFIKAIIFGIIEGITEWMPISSTAHMDILNIFLPLDVSEEFYEVFEVVIQLGAILALLLLFWKKIFPFGKSNKPLGNGILSYVKKDRFFLWIKIIIACLPAIIYELALDDVFTFVTKENRMTIIGIALILVGFLFIVVEGLLRGKEAAITSTRQITYLQALIIGLAQLVAAIFPGVSRSGATIIASLLLGIARTTAVEFTFELAIPVMAGASLMKLLKYALPMTFGNIIVLVTGCASAFIVSLFMIRFVLDYIKKNTFTLFGIYRILLGVIVLIFLR